MLDLIFLGGPICIFFLSGVVFVFFCGLGVSLPCKDQQQRGALATRRAMPSLSASLARTGEGG